MLDGIEADVDAYSALLEESEAAIAAASIELEGDSAAETSLPPLLILSCELNESETRVESQMARIDEIVQRFTSA